MKSHAFHRLAIGAVFFGLLAMAFPAEAQRQQRRGAATAEQVQYPDATREEPGERAGQRLGPQINRMNDAMGRDQFDRVIEIAEGIVANDRANAYERSISYQFLGAAHIEEDDYASALRYFKRAVEENGLPNNSHFQLMLQIVQLHFAEDEYDEAIAALDDFIAQSGSKRPEHTALRGNILYRMDRFEDAAAALRAAIEASDEPNSSWQQLLMASLAEMEQPEEAARIAEEIVRRNPNDKSALMNLASIYVQADMTDKAAQVLADARGRGLLTEARDYQTLYRLYLNIEGSELAAVEIIKEGLERQILTPNHEVYNIMGQAYYFADKPAEAIEAYRQAVPFAENGETALNLARVLYNEDRFGEAISAARSALDKGGLRRPGDAWIIIGNAEFYGNDDRNAGIAAFEQAARFPETAEQANNWLRQARRR